MLAERTARRLRARYRPAGEGLEARQVLSEFGPPFGDGPDAWLFGLDPMGGTLAIVGTEPADGATLTATPQQLTVLFDRPLDEFSLGLKDLLLQRLDSDGDVTWTLDPEAATLDATRTRLSLTLPDSLVLEPGRYRLALSDSAFLMGEDFSMLPTTGVELPLATFTVAPRGATLGDAVPLGVIGPQVRTVSDNLNFAADPHAVLLYRITLPVGKTWRFGAEVTAIRDGSPLDAALALFDAQGNLIAAADTGLPDVPEDPFLFAGLPGGTYYLGVSGAGNLPGQPGGYDPAAGTAGLWPGAGAGGLFRLHLVADEVQKTTRLLNFRLVGFDAHDQAPTGFTLQFSGLVLPRRRLDDPADQIPNGVELVDAFGRSWPVQLAGIDASQARLRYILLDRLPAGRYTVRLASQGALADLAGQAPLAPGKPLGTLATFEVVKARSPHDANDLGALFPVPLSQGVSRGVTLQPGESIQFRAVAVRGDGLTFDLRGMGGAFTVIVRQPATGQAWTFTSEGGDVGSLGVLAVDPGELLIEVSATGDAPATIEWSLRGSQTQAERLVLNGVGQGSALGLRLIQPGGDQPGDPGPLPPPGVDPQPTPGPGPGIPVPGVPVPIPTPNVPGPPTLDPVDGPSVGPAPGTTAAPSAGLLLALGGQPIGRFVPPPLDSAMGGGDDAPSAGVGLANQGGAIRPDLWMAHGDDGRAPVLVPPDGRDGEGAESGFDSSEALADAPRDVPAAIDLDALLAAAAMPSTGPGDWLARVAAWLAPSTPTAADGGARDRVLAGIGPLSIAPPDGDEASNTERADARFVAAAVLGLGLAGAVAWRARHRLTRWAGRRRGPGPLPGNLHAGTRGAKRPHAMRPAARPRWMSKA
jgi:hypothetical protein